MNDSFIKLFRRFKDWEWYSDVNVCRVFLHLLITVNWKDKRWQGQLIKRGSRITSYDGLARETNLTVMQVRTAIKKLVKTGEITNNSSNKNTLFTVVKYDLYQGNNKQNNEQITNEQQTNNKRITTTKEREERKESKEVKSKRFVPPTYEQVSDYCKERKNKVDPQRFVDFYESKGWVVGKSKMKSWKAAVRNWERSSGTNKQESKSKHNFEQRDYDFDELDKKMLQKQFEKIQGGI